MSPLMMAAAGRGRTAPDAPSALDAGSITATPGDEVVTISQNVAPSGGTSPYVRNLYRSTTNGVKGSELQAAVTLPYDDTTVTNDTTYYYTLEVVDAASAEDDSAQVSATPEASDLLLSCAWGTATGNSESAVTNGGQAIAPRYCSGSWPNILNVVDQATLTGRGISWTRTPNVLSIRSLAASCGHVEFENLFPLPDGSNQYWGTRYFMCNGTGQTDNKVHPCCFWPVGAIEAVHSAISSVAEGNGDWNHSSRWGAQATSWNGSGPLDGPLFGWFPMDGASRRVLARDVFYRVENIVHWYSATQYRIYPRLYNLAGDLLNDYTTWQHSDGAGTLESYYAAGGHFTRTAETDGADHIRTFSFGMGQAGASEGYYYIADVAAGMRSGITDYIGVG